jgi:hypothetical protein
MSQLSLSVYRQAEFEHNFSSLDELYGLSKQWAKWDIFTSLANYHSVVEILCESLTAGVGWW